MKCEACHKDYPDDAEFCPYCGKELHGGAKPTSREYAAFISYRHLSRDQEVAKRVQQAIETFKMPHGVAAQGRTDRRLGKCFRDEDELAAAHSLPDRILDALSKSSSLVVICTPNTKESIWVRREVDSFVEMHGRERVFTVLAEGSSSESIPDYLRTAFSSAGNRGSEHSGPLAADMRPSASGKSREETLRLIAAIAGCGFDDLKQRDKARRRKRIALAAIGAALVAMAVASALIFASGARQDSLAAESRELAAESEQLLAQGDRYGALEKALEALPHSASSNDRPLVPEARAALEDALGIEFDANHPWRLRYSIDAESEISAIEASPDEGWFAILDSDVTLSFYDIETGRKLSTARLLELVGETPTDADLDAKNWTIASAGSRLVVAERDGSCVLCCIEAETGDAVWTYYEASDALSISDDAEVASLLANLGDAFYVSAIHIPSGEWYGSRQFGNPGIPEYARELPSRMGAFASTLFVGFDKVVGRFDIADNTATSVDIPDSDAVLSVAHVADAVIVASTRFLENDQSSASYGTAPLTVSAYDDSLQGPIWSNETTWHSAAVDSERGYVGAEQTPEATQAMLANGPAIVVLAGNTVKVISVDDGDVLYEEGFAFPVVGANPIGSEDGDFDLFVTCADGSVNLRRIDGQHTPGGPIGFSYPGPVDLARIDWHHGKGCFAMARSLDNPHRMFVYQAESRSAEDIRTAADYPLDELIETAHDELAAVAQ